MEQKKLEKNLIFYSPGKNGSVFTFQAGNFCNDQLVSQAIDHLQYETGQTINWTEERRAKPRIY